MKPKDIEELKQQIWDARGKLFALIEHLNKVEMQLNKEHDEELKKALPIRAEES